MLTKDDLFANKIFLNSVLPLIKVIATDTEKSKKAWKNVNAIFQISAIDEDSKVGTHFIVTDGEWTVKLGTIEKPTIELEFSDIPHLNKFFQNKTKKLPKIHGWYKLPLLIKFMSVLLKMAGLLGATTIPKDDYTKDLTVKLFFYLLTNGISQLNKNGHEKIGHWAKISPNRVYALMVENRPDLAAYIQVKAGKSRSGRGLYTRSKPFVALRFDSSESALGILLEIDDMIESTVSKKLIMDGPPEYGAELGEYLLVVGNYAK